MQLAVDDILLILQLILSISRFSLYLYWIENFVADNGMISGDEFEVQWTRVGTRMLIMRTAYILLFIDEYLV